MEILFLYAVMEANCKREGEVLGTHTIANSIRLLLSLNQNNKKLYTYVGVLQLSANPGFSF